MESEPAVATVGGDAEPWSELWPAVSGTIPLNNGSYGATPAVLARAIEKHRRLVDSDRDHFFRRVRATEHERARQAAARFLGADLEGLALVPNASAGITAVLRSFPLQPGEQIMVTDHTYAAARLAAVEAARRTGAEVICAAVPAAAEDDVIVAALGDAVTSRTKLALIDHITSPTAEVWPIRRIVSALQDRAVAVLVDAAHAPGLAPTDLTGLNPDFWVGNFHKWAFSGIAVAALWVAAPWRQAMRPLIVSHDDTAGFPGSFGPQGTLDCSVIATLPAALALLEDVDGQALSARNARLASAGIAELADAFRGTVIAGGRRGAMTLLSLPVGGVTSAAAALRLQEQCEDRLGLQVAIPWWHDRAFLRLSVQGYVYPEHIATAAQRIRDNRDLLLR